MMFDILEEIRAQGNDNNNGGGGGNAGGEGSRNRGGSQRRTRGSDSGFKKDVKSEMGSLGELLLAKLEEKNKN